MSKKSAVPELIFTVHGTAELHRDGEVIWASDDDDEFAAENQNEFLNDDTDTDFIIEYLIDCGELDEGEELDVITETLDDTQGGDDE